MGEGEGLLLLGDRDSRGMRLQALRHCQQGKMGETMIPGILLMSIVGFNHRYVLTAHTQLTR
jgi:hypothetical protein